MDHALIRFQRAAARENRDRRTVRRRYSNALQQQAVAYWLSRRQQGEGMKGVAAALGIAPWSLYRWAQASEGQRRFRPVQIIEAPPTVPPIAVVMQADGLRVEGLDVATAAELLRRLR